MTSVQEALRILAAYKQEPESYGMKLRLNLAELVTGELQSNGWSQRELAQKAGLKEAYISRVLHSDQNCTFDTAGRILFALGVKAELQRSTRFESTEVRYGSEIDKEEIETCEQFTLRSIHVAGSPTYGATATSEHFPTRAVG